jgi:hypothetical protein
MANFLKNDSNKNVSRLFLGLEIGFNNYTNDELYDSNALFTNKMSLLKEEFGITKNLPSNSKLNLKYNPISAKTANIVSNKKLNESNQMSDMNLESNLTIDINSNSNNLENIEMTCEEEINKISSDSI